MGLLDKFLGGGEKEVSKKEILSITDDLPNILKAIELGPVNDKLAAIGKLHVIKGISLDVVQPVLALVSPKISSTEKFGYLPLSGRCFAS